MPIFPRSTAQRAADTAETTRLGALAAIATLAADISPAATEDRSLRGLVTDITTAIGSDDRDRTEILAAIAWKRGAFHPSYYSGSSAALDALERYLDLQPRDWSVRPEARAGAA